MNYKQFIEGYCFVCKQKYFDIEHPGRCSGRGVIEWEEKAPDESEAEG